ncbi:MAG: DUF4351 domain-containing protein [Magnetococcales bacterium]|nr:DUF4351 domain-containing protein [Magnetococcales bacterium]
MQGSLNSPEMEGITPEQVALLGREWLDFLVDTTPDAELTAIPKLEHLLVRRRQEGRQEEAAFMLLKQLRRKFGSTPDWVAEQVKTANLESIEKWSDNFVFANSVDEVFAS